jgi:molybdopterin converting factor small subunit
MQITVRLLASYRKFLPEDHDAQAGYVRQVAPGSSVGDVLEELPIPPEEVVTFLLNGRHAERGQVLKAGDVLALFPAMGGG